MGTLNDRPIKLRIGDRVKPVVQHVGRVPFDIRKKLESKLDELLESDIKEPVECRTPCFSPPVVVLKPSSELRVYVDMGRANEAAVRERHLIPTVEGLLYDINGAQRLYSIRFTNGIPSVRIRRKFTLHHYFCDTRRTVPI